MLYYAAEADKYAPRNRRLSLSPVSFLSHITTPYQDKLSRQLVSYLSLTNLVTNPSPVSRRIKVSSGHYDWENDAGNLHLYMVKVLYV
jgi:hypothetical protein